MDVGATYNLLPCFCQMVSGQSLISESCAIIALIPIILEGSRKARVFRSALGITKVDAPALRQWLLQVAVLEQAQMGELDKYGQRYTLDFEFRNGRRKAVVRSGWIILINETAPRLTTCYVQKRKR